MRESQFLSLHLHPLDSHYVNVDKSIGISTVGIAMAVPDPLLIARHYQGGVFLSQSVTEIPLDFLKRMKDLKGGFFASEDHRYVQEFIRGVVPPRVTFHHVRQLKISEAASYQSDGPGEIAPSVATVCADINEY